MKKRKGIIRASNSDKSEPSSHIGNRANWETSETGFGVSGFGKLGMGNVQGWAKGISKPFGRVRPNPNGPGCVCSRMPEVEFERNRTVPIRNLREIRPMAPIVNEPIPQEVGMPQVSRDDPRSDESRTLIYVKVRELLDKVTKGKVKKRGKVETEGAILTYRSKPIGKKGTKRRFFTKSQNYRDLPELPKSGGLSEEDLARMRERTIPRD